MTTIITVNEKGKVCTPAVVRVFHPTTIAVIAGGKFIMSAHAQVTGKVAVVRSETDGDIHVRLTDGTNFIICEIIPELLKARPKVGDTITIWGIVRNDLNHKWWEIHPVIGWKLGRAKTFTDEVNETGEDRSGLKPDEFSPSPDVVIPTDIILEGEE